MLDSALISGERNDCAWTNLPTLWNFPVPTPVEGEDGVADGEEDVAGGAAEAKIPGSGVPGVPTGGFVGGIACVVTVSRVKPPSMTLNSVAWRTESRRARPSGCSNSARAPSENASKRLAS